MKYTVEIAQGVDRPIPTIQPPCRAHVAFVTWRGLHHAIGVNCGQVTRLAEDSTATLMQGFAMGYARAMNQQLNPVGDSVKIDLSQRNSDPSVTEAYARWFAFQASDDNAE